MKKILLIISVLLAFQAAHAANIGYIDYNVIYKNLPLSQQYQKRLNAKAEQIRAYNKTTQNLMTQQKTPEAKEKIKNSRKEGLYKLEREYLDLRYKQEAVVKQKVKAASDALLAKKKFDIILSKANVVSGGIDCTQEIFKAIK